MEQFEQEARLAVKGLREKQARVQPIYREYLENLKDTGFKTTLELKDMENVEKIMCFNKE